MSSLARQQKKFIITALIVPVLLLSAFVLVPAVDLLRMSFTSGTAAKTAALSALKIISQCLKTQTFCTSAATMPFTFVHLLMIPVELGFAVFAEQQTTYLTKFYKTMVFLPYIINGVAIAYAFSYFFRPSMARLTVFWKRWGLACCGKAGCRTKELSILRFRLFRFGDFQAIM